MFKLDRLLMLFVIFLLNLCNVSCALSEFINLLKSVEEGTKIDCVDKITKTGVYKFQPDPNSGLTQCQISLEVPEANLAFIRPSQRTCETSSSANISTMCSRLRQEEQFAAGEHHFRFDASESVTITVNISPIIRLGCNEYYKNLHSLVNSVVIFENDENDGMCMIQLPPALEIHYLGYETSQMKRCCPDIFVVSSDLDENPVGYSESLSMCDIHSKKLSASSRCEATFMYLRGSSANDQVLFRVVARSNELVDECLVDDIPPPEYSCKKSKRKNRLRTKQSF